MEIIRNSLGYIGVCPPAKRTLLFKYKHHKSTWIDQYEHLTPGPKSVYVPEHFFMFDRDLNFYFGLYGDDGLIYPSGLTNIFGHGFNVCTGLVKDDWRCDEDTFVYLAGCFWQTYFSLCSSYLQNRDSAAYLNSAFEKQRLEMRFTMPCPSVPKRLLFPKSSQIIFSPALL